MAGRSVRLVAPDRRRSDWFAFPAGEILVSERVIERCPPAEASALLIDAILFHRRWVGVRRVLGGVAAADLALLVAGAVLLARGAGWVAIALVIAGGAGLLAAGVLAVVSRSHAGERADDEAVALLGDPSPLVRGLNLMNRDEIRLAGWRLPARPDLHRRAERLARLHRLCDGPAAARG